jgi:hypothetical protein
MFVTRSVGMFPRQWQVFFKACVHQMCGGTVLIVMSFLMTFTFEEHHTLECVTDYHKRKSADV